MSLEDIRRRYAPQPADQSELVKQLRARLGQQDRDIVELLAEIDRLQTGRPPGPPIVPGEEDASIAAELEGAGLGDYAAPRGAPTASREAENVAAHAARLSNGSVAATTRGIPIAAGFNPEL